MNKVYEIWESVDGTESTLLTVDNPHYAELILDLDGRPQMLKKKFFSKSEKHAAKVFQKLTVGKIKHIG